VKVFELAGVKSFALWIKQNSKAIDVFAGVFFLLTLLSGVAWVAGASIEPIAYVLGLFSSGLFGLPHLAEFILPSRKPIKDMTHDELLQFVKESHPRHDWKGISRNSVSEVYLREDPRRRFRVKYTREGVQCENYVDDWTKRHLHPHAESYWHDLYYDGNLVERFILVAVDGGMALLPPPDQRTGKIGLMDYKVAQIHDLKGNLDEYIAISGLEIDKNT
jgi:hypothetical protein